MDIAKFISSLDMEKIKLIIYNAFDNLYNFVDKNKVYIIIFMIIISILIFVYNYSETNRVKKILKTIDNKLVYTKNKEQIDFCGIDNSKKDKMRRVSIKSNKVGNYIEFVDTNINLYDVGITTDYLININRSKYADPTDLSSNIDSIYPYRIKSVEKNKILFTDEQKIKYSTDEAQNIEEGIVVDIVYYKPNTNINSYKYKKRGSS